MAEVTLCDPTSEARSCSQGDTAFSLFSRKLRLGALSHHERSPNALRLSYFEESKLHVKATCRHDS